MTKLDISALFPSERVEISAAVILEGRREEMSRGKDRFGRGMWCLCVWACAAEVTQTKAIGSAGTPVSVSRTAHLKPTKQRLARVRGHCWREMGESGSQPLLCSPCQP